MKFNEVSVGDKINVAKAGKVFGQVEVSAAAHVPNRGSKIDYVSDIPGFPHSTLKISPAQAETSSYEKNGYIYTV